MFGQNGAAAWYTYASPGDGANMRVAMFALIGACVWLSGCGRCNPGGPSGPHVQFSGTIAGRGLVYHDVTAPAIEFG